MTATKKTTIQKKKSRIQKPVHKAKRPPAPSKTRKIKAENKEQNPPIPATPSESWSTSLKNRQAGIDALIASDPWKAMQIAQEQLKYGVDVLSALIEKGSLAYIQKTVDGTHDFSGDEAARCLGACVSNVTQRIAYYALCGQRDCIASTWWAANLLTETVHDLAFKKETAHELEWYARRSLFLPSLRARPGTFTHDFQTVANTLHLSEDCLCHMTDTSAHKLDSPVTHFIAKVVEHIGWTQEHVRTGREFYGYARERHASADVMTTLSKNETTHTNRIDAMTEDEYLVSIHHCRSDSLHYDKLPPLTKATADEWWTKAVRQEITREFKTLEGTRLYTLLKGYKPHQKLDDLRRRSKLALRSLARPTPQNPHPS